MSDFNLMDLRTYMPGQDLMFLAGQPAVYHCHHFNLFLDQTIDDALGLEKSRVLRVRAGREFSHQVIAAVAEQAGAVSPPERLQLALSMFRGLGHGRLEIDADANGGTARGHFLHYGFAWHEKYGSRVTRKHGADAFAAGFAGGAVEVAYSLPSGSIEVEETQCIAMRASHCEFSLRRSSTVDQPLAPITEADAQKVVGTPQNGLFEEIIQPIAAGLKDFTAGVAGDERGLVQAFGVFVTMHLAGYYNRLSYDAIQMLETESPHSLPIMEELLRESGHVCVFNTFGGILLSPEWGALVGPLVDDPGTIAAWSMAIARSLGMGRWAISEFEPGKRMVMQTSSSYESVYYRTRHGLAKRPVEYLLQGAAVATAQLAHRVNWTDAPKLTPEFYQTLFKGGVPWKFEQTRSISSGDELSEIVVTHT